jgi:hypothetical protein
VDRSRPCVAPNSAALDADLTAGKINVTVFPDGDTSRTTTRYAERWMGAPAQPTLTVAVDGTSVTFGGIADLGQIAGILVDGLSYAYRTQPGDTPQLVAANLASMIRGKSIVQLSYSTLAIAGAGDLWRGWSPMRRCNRRFAARSGPFA